MANIALVNPPSHMVHSEVDSMTRVLYAPPPLGIAMLAACLEQQGHDVKILDSMKTPLHLENALIPFKSWKPDVIGFSVLGAAAFSTKELCRVFKEAFPDVLIFLGNAFPSEYPEWFLDWIPEADAILVGEGELSVVELLRIKPGTPSPGILWRDQPIETFEQAPQIEDLDSLPFPAWHFLDYNAYRASPQFMVSSKPLLGALQSRGCPWKCSFCAQNYSWPKVRFRSIPNLVQELKRNLMDYGIDEIGLYDSIFPMKPEFGEAFYREFEKEQLIGKIRFMCETRVDMVWKEPFTWLKKAGLHMTFLGIETPEMELLQSQQKAIRNYPVEKAAQTLNDLDILIYGLFMIGFPNETPKQRQSLKNLALSLPLMVASFGIYSAYAGSPFARKNSELSPMDLMEVNWAHKGSSISEELSNAQQELMRAFYLRPSIIWKYLTHGNIRWDRLIKGAWSLLTH